MMKEDYLWDKSGAVDAEIERLENALAVFRYVETDAPALPAKIVPFEPKKPRGFFRLAFAFGACAALVIISLGVWFQFSDKKVEVVKDAPETIAQPIADETSITEPNEPITAKTESAKQSVTRNAVKVKKSVPATPRQNNLTAQRVEVKKPTVSLTKEEKYAYDQLMLALSVTSSTFKKVKDKVDGVEEKNAVHTDGR